MYLTEGRKSNVNVIESHNLTKSYGPIHAIDHLSFQMKINKITGLIGRNGAGKTTLLKMIAGYIRPTGGELKVFSRNPFNNLTVSANTILIDEKMSFPDSFTLADILEEVAPSYANWDAQLAQGLFDYFNLNPVQRHSNLSKGTKGIFNAILGIASRCPLTLMDEPTTGMDSAVRKDFYRALLKDYIEHPRTIILSSHLLEELKDLLEDVLLLDQGKKRLHLPITELKEYALGLRGKAQEIKRLLDRHMKSPEIIYREEFAKDNLYVIVKKSRFSGDYETLRLLGVEIVPVSIDDLCSHLTTNTKGEIDDVFRRG